MCIWSFFVWLCTSTIIHLVVRSSYLPAISVACRRPIVDDTTSESVIVSHDLEDWGGQMKNNWKFMLRYTWIHRMRNGHLSVVVSQITVYSSQFIPWQHSPLYSVTVTFHNSYDSRIDNIPFSSQCLSYIKISPTIGRIFSLIYTN